MKHSWGVTQDCKKERAKAAGIANANIAVSLTPDDGGGDVEGEPLDERRQQRSDVDRYDPPARSRCSATQAERSTKEEVD